MHKKNFKRIKPLNTSALYFKVCSSILCFFKSLWFLQINLHNSHGQCFLDLCALSPLSDFAVKSHKSHLNPCKKGFLNVC